MGKLARPVLASVFAALAVAVALCVVHAPVYATPPDDFVQELFARGQFQAAASGGPMPYSLVLVSAPLSALYALAPAVPWYALMLLALIVVSFSVAYYRASALGLARWQLACVMCALITCEVLCVLYFTFTMVAFVSLAAGLMLIVPRATFGDAGRLRVSEVLGYLLVAVGFSLRPESGIAALLLFVPFLVWVLARNRRAASLGRALAVVLVIAASYGAGQLAYRSVPGWQDYPAYLDAGRTVLDSQQMAVGEARSRAPELSENDVAVMYDWDFVDHDVFDTDLFARIGSFETKYGVSNLAASLQAKVTYLLFGLAAALAVVALVLARMARLSVGASLLELQVVAMAFVSYLLVVMRGRPRLHIVIPIAIVTFLALIVCCEGPRHKAGRHARVSSGVAGAGGGSVARRRVAVCAVCAVCVVGLLGFWRTSVAPLQRRLDLPFASVIGQYVADNPDKLVVFGHTQSAWFSGVDAFGSASWDCPDNVMFVGGWESETPAWDASLERWGLDDGSPLMQLASRDDMVFVATERTASLVEGYLQEHVDAQVRATREKDLGTGAASDAMISVWTFSR